MLKRSIRARLLAAFGATSALILSIGVFSAVRLYEFYSELGDMLHHGVPRLILVDGMLADIDELGQSARGVLLAESDDEARKYLALTQEKRARIGEELEQLARIAGDGEGSDGQALREHLEAQSSGFLVGMVKFSREFTAGHVPEAKRLLLGVLEPKRLAMRTAIHEFRSTRSTALSVSAAESAHSYHSSIYAIAVLSCVAIGLGVVLGLWITGTIVAPIRRAMQVADDVAEGRLDRSIRVTGHDETARLIASLARMQTAVREMIESILRSARSVNSGAVEIAAGSSDIAGRTEQQAAYLQSTAETMQQLTEAVSKNAGSAAQASRLAGDASAAAQRGWQAMAEVMETMKGIAESSRRIEDILGVIDAIAFQTNILALNAAVEAARAGEQGRGFAIVAAEVRNLAQRSGNAAKEIKALIAESTRRVESGAEQVDSAGAQIGEIVDLVKVVTGVIAEISAAGMEQKAGITQVNDAVKHIDRTTRQNGAVVEQTSASASRLHEEAVNLVEALGAFKVDGDLALEEGVVPALPTRQCGAQPELARAPNGGPPPSYAAVEITESS